MVIVGAGALASAAQTFTIVRGKVIEKGTATLDLNNGTTYDTPTISVRLENDDRVFRIQRGTVVEYAVSENDAKLIPLGSEVEILVSSHSNVVRLVSSKP